MCLFDHLFDHDRSRTLTLLTPGRAKCVPNFQQPQSMDRYWQFDRGQTKNRSKNNNRSCKSILACKVRLSFSPPCPSLRVHPLSRHVVGATCSVNYDETSSKQLWWSSGYDSRLGFSKIDCERSPVRVRARACSFAHHRYIFLSILVVLALVEKAREM